MSVQHTPIRFTMTSGAKAPVAGSAGAAGHDVYASEAQTVPARGRAVVKTGLTVALPAPFTCGGVTLAMYLRVAPRSGLAVRGIDVAAGVVDRDYRGEIGVVLVNGTDVDFAVAAGDRVAQLIAEVHALVGFVAADAVDDTARGAGGFGSTGVSAVSGVSAVPHTTSGDGAAFRQIGSPQGFQ